VGSRTTRLKAIDGQPPDLATLAGGCAFAPRCAHTMDRCRVEAPPETLVNGQTARCWLHGS
jgi:oligopeptide/dipeptide ABC transporter ATP-binding protein